MFKTEIIGLTCRVTALLTLSLGWSGFSNALGLGGVEYKSYLGEPLAATIEIIGDGRNLGVDDVRVRNLLPPEAEALGVDLLASPYQFKLRPVQRDGRLFIRLTSRTPIREPFVDVLVELQWPNGVIYREYTLLLDLPPKEAAPTPVASRPQASNTQTPVSSRPARRRAPALDVDPGGSYRVRSGDSLSRIANRWREGKGHTLQDTSDWILEHNPRAFIGGDANRLIAGVELTMPDLGLRSAPVPVSGAPEYTSRDRGVSGAPSDSSPSSESVLQQSAAGKVYLGNAAAASSSDPDVLDASIRTQVESAREMNDLLARENKELRKRIERIENSGYNETFEKIVNLQQQQIDELRRQLEETVAQGQAARAKASADLAVAGQSEGDNQEVAQFTDTTAAAANQRAAAEEAVNPLWWVLLGLVIGTGCAAIYMLFGRRESEEDKDKAISFRQDMSELEDSEAEIESSTLKAEIGEIDVLKEDDLFGDSEQTHELPESIEDSLAVDDELLNLSINETMAPEELVEEDAVDKMIGTAYIYTSFGKFDEAKALLETQRELLGADPRFDEALADIETQRQQA